MSVGGQMSSQSGSGYHNDKSDTSQTGTTSGTTSSTMAVNPTALYGSTNNTLAGLLGGTGMTGGQQLAADKISERLQTGGPEYAIVGTNDNIDRILGGPTPTVGAGSAVSTPTAASLMGPYSGEYAGAVLNPSLAAFDRGVSINDNAIRTGRDSGSAFGDRAAVADSERSVQNATARGALAGQLTGQGLQWAGQMGAGDAGNILSGNTTTAGNTLARDLSNASTALAARGQGLQGEQQKAANWATSAGIGSSDAALLSSISQGGVGNLFSLLSGQVPAFGSSLSGSTTGSTANTLGTSSSGSSFNSGSGSSKGASIPFLG